MHGRVARYTYTGDAHEIARKAEEGMLPIFQTQSGFKAYSVFEGDGELISFSAWDSAESAEAANDAAASWVAENLADRVQLIDARTGEILFGTALGVSTLAATRA